MHELDTTTPAGKAMYQMMGVFAEFERSILQERIRVNHRQKDSAKIKTRSGIGFRLSGFGGNRGAAGKNFHSPDRYSHSEPPRRMPLPGRSFSMRGRRRMKR